MRSELKQDDAELDTDVSETLKGMSPDTSNSDPVCPYCGTHLKVVYVSDTDLWCYFACPHCGSRSPLRHNREDALLAAREYVKKPKGRWILFHKGWLSDTYRCSNCGNFFEEHSNTLNAGRGDKNYCPNCGAVMDFTIDTTWLNRYYSRREEYKNVRRRYKRRRSGR